jgi:hypothetical protein
LQTAWQQVKQNAGAAGIDQMTVEAFEQRKDELLAVIPHDFTRRQQPLELTFSR